MNEIWRSYYENGGIKEECTMRNGKLNGIATLYNEDGTVKEKRIYENDILMGNPFKGQSVEKIAIDLGLFLGDKNEWELASFEDEGAIEIDENLASILFFKK
ncbi:MAG: hypothetical protein SOY60_04980 [Fusobacterium gastrosuis]|uniref:toxin-antitoxin system YwqK family antitoxin n=1 Tax=Fusobacterium gastrosuis TaxID=1755100 RepID=UPI00297AF9B1|nr:hypothetical protein [Fusobacteriaceae bacterium]MDY4010999.1 hypothetical protein [Fusobacterium gastrosuis]MDY5713549.1 hypothetical protein [Fusobacterium gastrosuis]